MLFTYEDHNTTTQRLLSDPQTVRTATFIIPFQLSQMQRLPESFFQFLPFTIKALHIRFSVGIKFTVYFAETKVNK